MHELVAQSQCHSNILRRLGIAYASITTCLQRALAISDVFAANRPAEYRAWRYSSASGGIVMTVLRIIVSDPA